MKNNQNLIWIDLEMTGLDPERERIIEIATVVTDARLNVLAEGPVLAVHQEEALLASMDDWNTRQHHQSGLVKRVRESEVSEAQAEELTLTFLSQYLDQGQSPMCGNSICQDRRFLYKYMPKLAAFFHYRNLDVSTLKELAARWHPKILSGVTKQSKHLALEDIKDSIAELAYYRQHFMQVPDESM
ncbi:oligoribonuclease [Legionella oakridgensis]|uniref:Oligoribonuclease n=2 Tax=Legionella oakridgensis TaxID=29423 RepID=W0BBH6_9GAMM|nr:oligoribonuclease [Legionella oakridgensis]AHE66056.1 oligoribonuclease [Legionella oakridgensis ATCC 33761 = DSM 21215]ETO94123.1 oligoribonuclease (3''->5'' exoribonuclease) [Legionella oakridgensis RV-2-2007]KTD43811.1 oligoribonuclease [Legionella oakridgensis]STY15977.1 putative ACR [Legionella longbeachae]